MQSKYFIYISNLILAGNNARKNSIFENNDGSNFWGSISLNKF